MKPPKRCPWPPIQRLPIQRLPIQRLPIRRLPIRHLQAARSKMWGRVQVKTAGALPLSAADMRRRLRLEPVLEADLEDAQLDATLAEMVAAGASRIEGPDGAGLALMAQTWTLALDEWAASISLPGWPVTGVSEIRFIDPEGVEQVLDHGAIFRLIAGVYPSRLARLPSASFPPVMSGGGVIEIDYNLGRAAADDVDPGLITALALLAGHYFENREATAAANVRELPLGVEPILKRFARGVIA